MKLHLFEKRALHKALVTYAGFKSVDFPFHSKLDVSFLSALRIPEILNRCVAKH